MNKIEKVKKLIETYGQDDQRTEAWYKKRDSMLTASEIYKGLAEATPAQKHELIMSKLVPREQSSGTGVRALIWGTRFEPIAKEIYCQLEKDIKIEDLSCVNHPKVEFLGASPDGIILTENQEDIRYGKLVEFKCPISREFTKESPIPNAYVHQMQLQMECTELDECEYIEMQFKDLGYTEWMESTAPYKSLFAVLNNDNKVIYKDMNDTRSVAEWREQVLGKDKNLWELNYWSLNNWRSITVKHDLEWLPKNLPSLTSVWEEIVNHRTNGTIPQSPREKTTLML